LNWVKHSVAALKDNAPTISGRVLSSNIFMNIIGSPVMPE